MTLDYQIKNNRYEFFAALFILWSNIVNIVLGFSRHFISIGKIDTIILYCILLAFFFSAIKIFVSRFQGWMITTSLLVVFIILFSSLFSQDSSVSFEVLRIICTSCLPVFLVVCCIRNVEALYYYLVKTSVLIPILGLVLMTLFPFEIDAEGGSYSQGMAYLFLIPTMLQVSLVVRKLKILNVLSLLCGFFVILSYGARGPFICILMFLLICFARNVVEKNGSILPLILIGLLFLVIMRYWNTIVMSLFELFSSMGFSTRTLQKLIEEEMFVDDTRGSIYSGCISHILYHPFIGTFPVNDRFLVAGYSGDSFALGCYPHNFFLEIFLQFGLIPGLILLYFYGRLIYRAFNNAGSKLSTEFLLLFLCAAILPLQVSGSYLQDDNFYISFAMLIAYSKGLILYDSEVR